MWKAKRAFSTCKYRHKKWISHPTGEYFAPKMTMTSFFHAITSGLEQEMPFFYQDKNLFQNFCLTLPWLSEKGAFILH